MTRSSRKTSERFGRPKWRRHKYNDRKRSARCQQRSDLASNRPSTNVLNHINKRSRFQYFDKIIATHINTNSFKKMKNMWDKCTPEQRMSVFEALGNKVLEHSREICYSWCTLEDFGQFFYDVCECHDHFDKWVIDINVAIKRVYRRGSSKKFVSHRKLKEKYAF